MTAPQTSSLKVRYVRSLRKVEGLDPREVPALEKVAERYAFRANEYYLGLIDWDDPDDPIRRLIVPDKAELNDWGKLDASDEAANTVERGVQHKYRDTALVLAASTCAAYCRYCFRKRLFMDENEETTRKSDEGIAYVADHPEVTDVLLTGGDPLILSSGRLGKILDALGAIDHVQTVRLGSKTIAFNPFRVTEDPALCEAVSRVVDGGTTVYLMAHFDHPREVTEPVREAVAMMQRAGAHVVNQCPMVRGVNDDVDVLTELFETMTAIGAPQYYLFQGRPTAGNEPYEVPLVEAWHKFDAARRRCSGLSRRARFCMSHATGKIEILGVDDAHIYLRWHRAKDPAFESRVAVCRRDDEAFWFDDLETVTPFTAAS